MKVFPPLCLLVQRGIEHFGGKATCLAMLRPQNPPRLHLVPYLQRRHDYFARPLCSMFVILLDEGLDPPRQQLCLDPGKGALFLYFFPLVDQHPCAWSDPRVLFPLLLLRLLHLLGQFSNKVAPSVFSFFWPDSWGLLHALTYIALDPHLSTDLSLDRGRSRSVVAVMVAHEQPPLALQLSPILPSNQRALEIALHPSSLPLRCVGWSAEHPSLLHMPEMILLTYCILQNKGATTIRPMMASSTPIKGALIPP